MASTVKCPTCGRSVEWTDANPFRPFCSERCRLVDLGAWMTEQRSIPDETAGAPMETDADGADPAPRR